MIEKFKNIKSGVPPDEAATSSGKVGRGKLPHDTDKICDTQCYFTVKELSLQVDNIVCCGLFVTF